MGHHIITIYNHHQQQDTDTSYTNHPVKFLPLPSPHVLPILQDTSTIGQLGNQAHQKVKFQLFVGYFWSNLHQNKACLKKKLESIVTQHHLRSNIVVELGTSERYL